MTNPEDAKFRNWLGPKYVPWEWRSLTDSDMTTKLCRACGQEVEWKPEWEAWVHKADGRDLCHDCLNCGWRGIGLLWVLCKRCGSHNLNEYRVKPAADVDDAHRFALYAEEAT